VGGARPPGPTYSAGRADPARSAHLSAEWRRGWTAKKKRKNSLRREKVKWVDQAEFALPVSDVPRQRLRKGLGALGRAIRGEVLG
jgi:hypothetical protein